MKIYLSGIGGVGIGPLALISKEAGFDVLGSDREESLMTQEISTKGILYSLDQSGAFLQSSHQKSPIDWFIYTAALPPDHPELKLAKRLGIKIAKRDELLAYIIKQKRLKLIAVAGTHGKTSTTGLLIWILKQLNVPISYSVGTTLIFGSSGSYHPESQYFIYECDEFDRNFLNFYPYLSLITNIDYDHPDTFATKQDYYSAFYDFIKQSEASVMWQDDINNLNIDQPLLSKLEVFDKQTLSSEINHLPLAGRHNRENAYLALEVLSSMELPSDITKDDILAKIKVFPGTNRRFECLDKQLYSDYGHHPNEIAATLQMARELSDNVTLVYQPHQNQRQHEIKHLYTDKTFDKADTIYWLPTYLTRENPNQSILSPKDLTSNLSHPNLKFAELNQSLWNNIVNRRQEGSLVLCMGAGTIDSWARQQLSPKS
ncbi:hypothetical protein GX865_02820 [Candidatus Saccharibacteria bacterium]|jgi:UDP-N-acetylmuramate--alanine ligase|nr:hypothetical protein [Candidatus Saccharibacteria bacterium]